MSFHIWRRLSAQETERKTREKWMEPLKIAEKKGNYAAVLQAARGVAAVSRDQLLLQNLMRLYYANCTEADNVCAELFARAQKNFARNIAELRIFCCDGE